MIVHTLRYQIATTVAPATAATSSAPGAIFQWLPEFSLKIQIQNRSALYRKLIFTIVQ